MIKKLLVSLLIMLPIQGNIINSFIKFPAADGGFDKTGLLAWWDLETNGTDSHDAGPHPFDTQGTPLHTTSSGGKVGEAVDFEQASEKQYYKLDSHSAFDITGALSIGCWVNFESTPSTGNGLISKYLSAGSNFAYVIANQPSLSDKFQFIVSGSGSDTFSVLSTTEMSTGTWYFVVATYEPSTAIRIYVNGTNEATNTTSIPSALHQATGVRFVVGSWLNATQAQSVDGKMDSVFVFTRLLTGAEITTLYNDGLGMAYSDL